MSVGEELLSQLREQLSLAGDPRITPEGREILRRMTTGDLAQEFADSLAEINDSGPLLSGVPEPDDDLV